MKNKNLIIGILVFALILLFFGGFGGMMGLWNYGGYGMMGMMYGYDYSIWTLVFNWIYMVLIIVALVLLIIWLARQIQKK